MPNKSFFMILSTLIQVCTAKNTDSKGAETMPKQVCVIGAGVAGLSSARHLLAAGQHVTVLEATAFVGGTWRYEPRVGADEYGRPIHTSMYSHLRTNLPKQTMELPGFPIPVEYPTFPTGKQYYEYLKSFADHFNLREHIKFFREVTLVTRSGRRWRVKHRDVRSGEEREQTFDYVFVCNGHHSRPNVPDIPKQDLFKGTIIHSHDYRSAEPYRNRRVLIIGAGPSAMDIGLYVADISAAIFHSHHAKYKMLTPFPDNYHMKPDVVEFTETGAVFEDRSVEEFDDVIYCTGFEYSYPFLDETSGLTVEPRSVTPLYRYVVNINQPTMLLLGLVVRACLVVAIDAQARYGAALVSGRFALPSHDEMMADFQSRVDAIRSHGRPLSDIHLLANDEDQYYANLTSEASIDRVPPVMAKIRMRDTETKQENLFTYRNFEYMVLNNETYTRVYVPPESHGI